MRGDLCLVLTIISSALAAPVTDEAQARIVSYENSNDGTGNYDFSYETSNGLKRQESGRLVNKGQPHEHIEVIGSFSYIDSEGKVQVYQYTADDNGYHVVPSDSRPGYTHYTTSTITPMAIYGGAPPQIVATLLGR